MKISESDSDEAILEETGRRLARRRIARRLSQADLAERAGVGKRTVERMEAGGSVQMTTLIRLLRVLELLPALEELIPSKSVRPMELLRHSGRMPQRVRKQGAPGRDNTEAPEWRWAEPGDDAK